MSEELLRLTNVSRSYRRGSRERHVLRDVSFAMDVGEVLGIFGDRGQGKTTLLEILAGIQSADAGSVRFAGRELGTLSDRERSRLLGAQIALAGKSGPRMDLRMLDYVELPLLVGSGKDGARRRARSALERVGAWDCADQEWDDLCDWERALVEVAQAIAADPALLLVDDLSDALGIRETDAFAALLRSLSRETGMGVLMAVSDADAALYSDRIMRLSGGRLIQAPRRPVQAPRSPGANVLDFPDRGVEPRHVEHG